MMSLVRVLVYSKLVPATKFTRFFNLSLVTFYRLPSKQALRELVSCPRIKHNDAGQHVIPIPNAVLKGQGVFNTSAILVHKQLSKSNRELLYKRLFFKNSRIP